MGGCLNGVDFEEYAYGGVTLDKEQEKEERERGEAFTD